jgi:hypothetical protein
LTEAGVMVIRYPSGGNESTISTVDGVRVPVVNVPAAGVIRVGRGRSASNPLIL